MFRECTRLLAFARPYWKEWFLALVFMFLYTAASGAQLVLIKPVLDQLSKSSTLPSPTGDAASPTTERPDSAAPQKNLQQDGIRDYLRQFIPEGLRTFWARHTNSYKGIGLLAIALAPLIFLFGYAQDYLKHFVMWRAYVDISNRLCASLLPQSLSFFEARKSGELMSRLTNDLYFTQAGIVILFEDVMLQPLRLLCGLVLALYFSGKLFLLVLIGLPVMLFPVIFLGKKIRKHGKATLERMGWLTEALREILAGIRIIKAYKMEEEEQREFQEINEGLFKKRMKWSKAAILNQSSGEFFYALGLGGMVIGGGYVVGTGSLTFGELGGFIAACMLIFRSTRLLSRSYSRLQEALAGASRIFELLDHPPQLQDHPQAVELGGMEREVTFKKVGFAYNSEKVLEDITFQVKKGEVVGIVGESGAGKTTLVNLLSRFYEPTEGSIEIDGKDIRLVKRASLVDNIALVTQQTFLFNRSVAENILCGKRDASLKEVEEAAGAAYIHEFVSGLPKGYDTSVGELGVKVSGGQRQRIAIARAILKNAPILILDEATSALDAESEKLVHEALVNLMKGKTTFIIAHRMSTLRHCDKILVLKDGRLVEMGTHEELMSKGGEYCRLYQAHQMDGE
ncbi:MAG: ABC transporter ATP-binding protein [Planctomycetes bacterium]|nr:ABC transporter ATP-binding protein [Planctomycetota bacterium]